MHEPGLPRARGSRLGATGRDESLYDNLSCAAADFDRATVEMQRLVADVRREPKKYIRLKVF